MCIRSVELPCRRLYPPHILLVLSSFLLLSSEHVDGYYIFFLYVTLCNKVGFCLVLTGFLHKTSFIFAVAAPSRVSNSGVVWLIYRRTGTLIALAFCTYTPSAFYVFKRVYHIWYKYCTLLIELYLHNLLNYPPRRSCKLSN
jgi:hypothetical protein